MAGVKGRSGGPRPNSGGKRPGAGRKPKPPPVLPQVSEDDPLKFLLKVQADPEAPLKERVRAAIAAAPYIHPKVGEGGKKQAQKGAAGAAGGGKFAAAAPPKLVVNNRR